MKEQTPITIQERIDLNHSIREIREDLNLDNYLYQKSTALINNAQKILNENKHCEMYFILDDDKENLHYMIANLQAGFKLYLPEFKRTAVISVFKDSPSLLKTFSEFNSEGNNLKKDNGLNKYIVVDGNLGNFKDETQSRGDKFIYCLISECIKNNWEIPYVIGCSADKEMNKSIETHINLSLSGFPENINKWEHDLREENNFDFDAIPYITAIEGLRKIANQECPYYIANNNYEVKTITTSIIPHLKNLKLAQACDYLLEEQHPSGPRMGFD